MKEEILNQLVILLFVLIIFFLIRIFLSSDLLVWLLLFLGVFSYLIYFKIIDFKMEKEHSKKALKIKNRQNIRIDFWN